MKTLRAWCRRCRDYMPVDQFAGMTTYKQHTNNGATACENSGKPCPFKARDTFAGAKASSRRADRGDANG
jgi:hypothetical protein